MSVLLLLIDFQRDFLSGSDLQPAAGALVGRASFLLKAARACGRPVIHVRTTVTRTPDTRMAHWKESNRWRCLEGTEGHGAPDLLMETKEEKVVHKQGFSTPGLSDFAAECGANTVIIAGVMTHGCVRQAALDLYQAGFRIWIAEDAVGSDDAVHAAITRRYLEDRSVSFAASATLAGAFARGSDCIPPSRCTESVARVVEKAVCFARTWRSTDFADRVALVERTAGPLLNESDSLAEQMARELGKPVRFGRTEVIRTAEMIHAIAKRLSRLNQSESLGSAQVRRRPHGVMAVITPWNNPIYLALGKIIPAILCRNTVVWKSAPEASAVARRIINLFSQCGWPENLVQLLEGGRREGQALISQPGINAVTITGSLTAGYSATEICARRHVPLQAELGGNNAAIVWADANLATAAEKLVAGAFEMTGQRCTANRRVVVHKSVRQKFLELLKEKASKLAWGDPLDPEIRIGPMVSDAHRDRVADAVCQAVADGAVASFPQGKTPPKGASLTAPWDPPVILECPAPTMEIVQEESFGPVLVVQTASDWAEAMSLCNGVRQGLAAAIFTESNERIQQFLDEAQAGILKINVSTADAAVDVPFGGWKASGIGPPEHGDSDIEFYSRSQTVYS